MSTYNSEFWIWGHGKAMHDLCCHFAEVIVRQGPRDSAEIDLNDRIWPSCLFGAESDMATQEGRRRELQ